MCLVVEFMITIEGPNSTIEKAFSVLPLKCSWLIMSHASMENLMKVIGIDKLWTEIEKALGGMFC